MKQKFINILTFLYLVSGIGFGSAHHHCLHTQKMILVNDGGCCADDFSVRSSKKSQLSEITGDHACCAFTGSNWRDGEKDTYLPENCCKVHHTYSQTDTSPLPQISAVNPVIHTVNERMVVPPHQKRMDGIVYRISADPFTHVNLPLLN